MKSIGAVVLIIALSHKFMVSAVDLTICKHCTCQEQTIQCEKIQEAQLLDPDNWIVTRNDTAVVKLVVKNSNWGTIQGKFPKIPHLQHLDLSDNGISTIAQSVFENLQDLVVLDLSRNGIKQLGPDTFKGRYQQGSFMPLKSLRHLKLDHNDLETLDADLFEHIEDLEDLDLSYNPFGAIDDHSQVALSSLQKLKIMDLAGTKMQELPDKFLYTHKNLETLNLSNNPMVHIPKTLRYASALVNLYLNGTYLRILNDTDLFPDLPSLLVLHLSRCEALESIRNGTLAGLTNLEELYLCDNPKLSFIDQMSLGKRDLGQPGAIIYPPVRKLHIQNNNLTYLESDFLANWQRLVDLDARGNKWACECQSAWLITVLTPLYERLNGDLQAKQLQCGLPVEMEGRSMLDLYKKNYHVRCLDKYGAHPENDAALLVGVLAGVLVALPVCFFLFYAYKRQWFGFCSSSPAAYSRQFYGQRGDIYEDDF